MTYEEDRKVKRSIDSRLSAIKRGDISALRFAVQSLELIKGDDESAHARENSIWAATLEFLADSGSEMAKEALKTRDIEFSRWFA